jgi:NTP pyrophosphatase (non-canonical NTP hydrolase)
MKQLPGSVALEIIQEYLNAREKFAPFNSAHEGYAVIMEEVDELWDEVKKNGQKRSLENLRKEAIQVGAMAVAFILDLDLKKPS